jgi:hypothetical protein
VGVASGFAEADRARRDHRERPRRGGRERDDGKPRQDGCAPHRPA